MRARGSDAIEFSRDTEIYGVAAVRAGDLRSLSRKNGEPCPHGVMADPTPEEPWHGVTFKTSGKPRIKGEREAIADRAFWVIPLIG